jgi:hypothetical protein
MVLLSQDKLIDMFLTFYFFLFEFLGHLKKQATTQHVLPLGSKLMDLQQASSTDFIISGSFNDSAKY